MTTTEPDEAPMKDERRQAIEAMHAKMHPGPVVASINKCPNHDWLDMVERYDLMHGAPAIETPQQNLIANDDGTINVDGVCPSCTMNSLVIGALDNEGNRTHQVRCQNVECISPMTAHRLLNFSHPVLRREKKPVETIALPEPPEADPASVPYGTVLDGWRAMGDPVRWESDYSVADSNETSSAECGFRNLRTEVACTYAPHSISTMHSWQDPDDPDYTCEPPAGETPVEAGQNVARSIGPLGMPDMNKPEGERFANIVMMPAPVTEPGPDRTTARAAYTCHVDRCGATPERPCKMAVETLDEVHDNDGIVIALEVPDEYS